MRMMLEITEEVDRKENKVVEGDEVRCEGDAKNLGLLQACLVARTVRSVCQ